MCTHSRPLRPDAAPPPTGIELIARERERQVLAEGYTAAHDDAHADASLVAAAVTYATLGALVGAVDDHSEIMDQVLKTWPWERRRLRICESPLRNLEKAGALIAAEIDRLLREQERIRNGG